MDHVFDLNIEKILDNWTICDGLREIISNAIDEQILTNTPEIEIYKDENQNWHIRDYGRGLQYQHFTQNENVEKVSHPQLIGKFGVGLKDALATFDRNNVDIKIVSKHCNICLTKEKKHGFDDITTLHALISETDDDKYVGTDFIFSNISDNDIIDAKQLFLMFSNQQLIDKTKYGEVLASNDDESNIYINGVKVATEENFLFSYNITNIDKKIKQALNRERTNVGRSAYSDRIKSILLTSSNTGVANSIANQLKGFTSGDMADEVKWIDVQEHAIKILNTNGKSVFISNLDAINRPDMIDDMQREGYEIVIVPENLLARVENQTDISGNQILNSNEFYNDYNSSFAFEFVSKENLNRNEKEVYKFTKDIIETIGGLPKNVKEIKISNNMRKDIYTSEFVHGLWMREEKIIVINRSQLKSIESYAGTLIHEVIHAKTDFTDVSREFENQLTAMIGKLYNHSIKKKNSLSIKSLFNL